MASQDSRRVLIVDDDVDGAEGLAEILEVQGLEVGLAHTPAEALDKTDDFLPQVALVDLKLGRESGLHLIPKLKEKMPELPCLVVTGNADRDSAIGALRGGAYDYLTKPVDPEELLQAVQRALDLVTLLEDNQRMIEELREAKERAELLALNDSLTGLANRYSFQMQLDQAINNAKRLGRLACVAIIDLDGFKQVNDTYGHLVGDELLKEIALRFKACVRTTDTVARLGGDEFSIIFSHVETPDQVGRPIEKILEELQKPVSVGGLSLEIGASIGVSLCPPDSEDGAELIRRADVALYSAKSAGPGTMRYYDPEIDARAQIRRELERDLKRAFRSSEFRLYYQPQVALDTFEVSGVEALLRWEHPRRGLLSPIEFIDAAESCGLILELGRWVIWEACRQAQVWSEGPLSELRVAVNTSPRQLRGEQLLQAVEAALQETGVAPSQLELELTENAVMADEDQAAWKLTRLREIGIDLSIDDFGTGHSSLARLKEYPVNRLKIDRTFVNDLTHDTGDQSICLAAVQLANSLGLGVVAEGVENEDQIAYLRSIGCDEAQGFYFSQALPADELERWVEGWRLAHPPGVAARPAPTAEVSAA